MSKSLPQSSRLQLLLVDPQQILRTDLRAGLMADTVISVDIAKSVGEQHHITPQVALVTSATADDIFDTLQDVQVHLPTTRVVVVGAELVASHIIVAFNLGARGYVSVDVTLPDLLHTLRFVARGGIACCPITTYILEESLFRTPKLTRAESDIAARIADGQTNEEIARGLGITVNTVETQVRRICKKLGRRSRVDIAAWWTWQQIKGKVVRGES
jgi:DNA-binding NarL/FixJ family response regulator